MDNSCSQLAHELVKWTISPSDFVSDFGPLVRYVYNDCTADNRTLQHLVAQFAACLVEDVTGFKHWTGLLTQVPAFAIDLISQIGAKPTSNMFPMSS